MHNHILVNVDDGPQTKEDAVLLLKQAVEEGVTGIIATPHYTKTFKNTFNKVELKVKELCKLRDERDLDIQIYPGQEVRISDHIMDDIESGKIKGLNHSRYLLIELPHDEVPEYTISVISELIENGFTPTIAHPERNMGILKDMNILYDLIGAGALSQITSTSLAGYFGIGLQLASIEIMNCHLAHFIASDAHHYEARPFILNSLYEEQNLLPLKDEITLLIHNAEAIIKDERILKQQPIKPTNQELYQRYLF